MIADLRNVTVLMHAKTQTQNHHILIVFDKQHCSQLWYWLRYVEYIVLDHTILLPESLLYVKY